MTVDDDLDAMPGGGGSSTGGRGFLIVVAVVAVLVVAAIAGRSLMPPGAGGGGGASGGAVAEGKRLFEARCSSCHGNSGRGDGPIARGLSGPGPGDLTDDDWKHGDQPDQVIAVIAKGVPGTQMAGWDSAFDEGQIRALAAYMYRLAGREAPGELLGESAE
ncbi:c-type cytochrome [Tautonia sp. JC769]|uniref:c-type cytochrome n=1 Tax=Tautonia sp. JC769 TaxID=3232135 RepID=UPI00345AB223